MPAPMFCKRCSAYLLDHRNATLRKDGWKYCPSCNWACNKDGHNLIDTQKDADKKDDKKEDKNDTD